MAAGGGVPVTMYQTRAIIIPVSPMPPPIMAPRPRPRFCTLAPSRRTPSLTLMASSLPSRPGPRGPFPLIPRDSVPEGKRRHDHAEEAGEEAPSGHLAEAQLTGSGTLFARERDGSENQARHRSQPGEELHEQPAVPEKYAGRRAYGYHHGQHISAVGFRMLAGIRFGC